MPTLARSFTGLLAAAVLSLSAAAQDIKCEKYKLDNGMTVILYPDRALPVGAVNIWYRVGARNEPAGRSGFAHLFEHLMFMGTERVPGNSFDTIMEAGGGSNNASTSLDRTNYFSSGPASLLPTLLWLDADRLEDLARTMDQAKLDKQRDVVRNEMRQNVENRPYGRAEELVYRLMYPKGHPYHEAVYGTHQDLEAATVWDVKDFFSTFYVPNNASLVVAGDFDPEAMKPLVRQLFGTLPRGAEPPQRTAEPARLDRVVRTTLTDKVELPLVKMVWHSPAYYADGDAEMDLAGALLSQGKNSRLYKRLIFDEQLAAEVSARQDSAGLGSVFIIDVLARPGADLDRIERIIDEEVAKLAAEGRTQEELDERKATIELAMLAQLQSIESIADKLNEYEYAFGEPNSFKRDLDRYRDATPARVQFWIKRILDPGARAIIRILPEQPERTSAARDPQPPSLSMAQFEPVPPRTFNLSSGIPVMLWRKPELPLVGVSVVFRSPSPLDEPGTAGLSLLAAQMTEEGAGDLDALQFAAAMQRLGAVYSAGASQHAATASVTVLRRNFDKALNLMADALLRPRNTEPDWERIRSLHMEQLRQQDQDPAAVAARVGQRILFGDESPYAWPMDGTVQTIETLKLADVLRAQRAMLRPDAATILVAGDITAEEARESLERVFAGWRSSESPAQSAAANPAQKHEALRVIVVDRPGAVQTVVRFVMPGIEYADARRVEYRLINTLLGGSFTSRLNQNIREDKGYSYGARSRFTMQPGAGWFVASSSVQAEFTGPAVKEFLAEFSRLRSGDISAEEAAKASETLRTDVIRAFQGLSGLLGAASDLVVNGVPFTTLADDLARMQQATPAALNSLANQSIPLEQGVLVLVGDRSLIIDQIKSLGLPPAIECNPDGTPAGK